MENEGSAGCPLPCSSNTIQTGVVPAPIRKRRFSSAKIQPTRVKKVMQSDEEIGRMVASVPVAIGRAMEHFAEKLLEAAAMCVHCSTSRTLSPAHMKQAMMQYRHFGFLEPLMRDIQLPARSTTEVIWHPEQMQQSPFQQMQFQQPQFPQAQVAQPVMPMIVPGPSEYAEFIGMQMASVQQPNVVHATSPQANCMTGPKRRQSNGTSEPQADGKPKRGRPRKIRKEDKCVDEEGILGETKKEESLRPEGKASNGFPLTDSELMPPPTMLPLRITRACHNSGDNSQQLQCSTNLPLLPQAPTTSETPLSTASDRAF